MVRSTLTILAIMLITTCGTHAQDVHQSAKTQSDGDKITADQQLVKVLEVFESLKREALTEWNAKKLVELTHAFTKQLTRLKTICQDAPATGEEPTRDDGLSQPITPKKTTIGQATIKPGKAVKASDDTGGRDIKDMIEATLKTHQPTLKLRGADEVRESKLAKIKKETRVQLCSMLLQASSELDEWLTENASEMATKSAALNRRLAFIQEALKELIHRDRCVAPNKVSGPPK